MNKLFRYFALIIFFGIGFITYSQDHSLINRKFQGIPSLAISAEGRLWATWYAGKTPDEDQNNYVVIATSGDKGKSWSEKHIVDPDEEGPLRAFDPELWVDPNGVLWSFWAETIGHDGAKAVLWAQVNKNMDNENSNWSKPFKITNGVMMCKPTVLSSGEWVFPVSSWKGTAFSAKMIVSLDEGKTFFKRGACDVPADIQNYDEHMIVERKDKSLWMLVRTKYGIGESVSNDKGETWSNLLPSNIQHPPARFFIRRLQSGNLLLVKHGLIDKKSDRSDLTAYVSKDDGKTWSKGLVIDARKGVSYPDGQQDKDGVIHIIYDYSRTDAGQILMAKFNEADTFTGDTIPISNNLRMNISHFADFK